MNIETFQDEIKKYCSTEIKKYSVWVYAGNEIIQVYPEQLDNTEEIFFQFRNFNHFYWKVMEKQCIENNNDYLFYNSQKMKMFYINYLLINTNMPSVFIDRDQDGVLTKDSLDSFLSIHPRILRVLFDKIDMFPKKLNQQQEKDLQKQCSQLFGKGKSVINPNEWIVLYCNLVAFWDKFGMNYNDVMSLPNDTFLFLKKIMQLDNDNKMKNLSSNSPKKKGKGVGF